MGELEHPYQHPYALALVASLMQMRDDGAQHVGQDPIAGTTCRNRLGGQSLGQVTRSHTLFDHSVQPVANGRNHAVAAALRGPLDRVTPERRMGRARIFSMSQIGPTLETPRLILRPPEAADFEPWAAFAADPVAARFLGGRSLARWRGGR